MSILGDISQAVPLDHTPLHYRFPARLARLENIRTGIDSYLSTLDKAEPVPEQQYHSRSILEEGDSSVDVQYPDIDYEDVEPGEEEKGFESDGEYVDIAVTPVEEAEKPIEIPRKPGKRAKGKRRIVLSKQRPKRDFIRENILNLKTMRKEPSPLGQIGEEWVGKLLKSEQRRGGQSEDTEKPLVLKGILKSRTPPPTQTTIEAIRDRMEAGKVVRNSGLLSALFDKVADTFALNWEAAAESLISDLLSEEAELLTSLETTPPEPVPISLNITDLLSLVRDYRQEEEVLRKKYCVE